jgi:DNA-directed RNA polymerase
VDFWNSLIQNSGSFFENKLAKLINQIENLKQMDLQAYKEIFDGKGNILENIEKMILENSQLKETLENIKNSLEFIYSDAKVNIKDENVNSLIKSYQQLSLLSDSIFGVFPMEI